MVVIARRERYRVDLIGLQAACEANYARLMRLLPDMREQPVARRIAVTQGDQMLGVLTLEVIQDCPYTARCGYGRNTACRGCRYPNCRFRCTTMRAWLR